MSAKSPARRCRPTTGTEDLPSTTAKSLASGLADGLPPAAGSTVITIGTPLPFGFEPAIPAGPASKTAIIPVTTRSIFISHLVLSFQSVGCGRGGSGCHVAASNREFRLLRVLLHPRENVLNLVDVMAVMVVDAVRFVGDSH